MHQQIYKNKQVNKCLIIRGVESIPQLGVQKANWFLQNFLEDSQETGSSWSWSGAETLFHSTSKELYINEALSFIRLKLSQSKKNLVLVLVRPGAYVLQTRVKIQIQVSRRKASISLLCNNRTIFLALAENKKEMRKKKKKADLRNSFCKYLLQWDFLNWSNF